jgi:hypothetical protein
MDIRIVEEKERETVVECECGTRFRLSKVRLGQIMTCPGCFQSGTVVLKDQEDPDNDIPQQTQPEEDEDWLYGPPQEED